jgi:hypothetical protein
MPPRTICESHIELHAIAAEFSAFAKKFFGARSLSFTAPPA